MAMDNLFGIRKVIGCKLSEDGKRMYKVKWEATWESEDSLSDCKLLIENFWSTVTNACKSEYVAREQGRKRLRVETDVNTKSLGRVKNQAPHHSSEALDTPLLRSPSTTLSALVSSLSEMKAAPVVTAQCKTDSSKTRKELASPNDKLFDIESEDGKFKPGSKKSSSSNLAILETFDHPFVKIVVACKICSKEQPMKRPSDWKKHYYTHASNEEKPYKCQICGKGFAQSGKLKSHGKVHINDSVKAECTPIDFGY